MKICFDHYSKISRILNQYDSITSSASLSLSELAKSPVESFGFDIIKNANEQMSRTKSSLSNPYSNVYDTILNSAKTTIYPTIKLINGLRNITSSPFEVLRILDEKLPKTDFNEVDFNNYEDDVIEEAQVFVLDTFRSISITSNESTENLNLQQNFKKKIEDYKKKNPIYAYILSLLIPVIIMNFIINPIGECIKETFNKSKSIDISIKDIRKEVKDAVTKNYYYIKKSIINHYRYINKNKVLLRKNHFMNSSAIVELNNRDVINLLYDENKNSKKRFKNWLYVEYVNKDDEVYRGWVNNIYTEKI